MANQQPKIVHTENAPFPSPVLSQGLIINNTLYCSGQLPIDPKSGLVVQGNIKDRAEQILRNSAAILEAGGSGLQHVIKTTVFLTDIRDIAVVNEVYGSYFGMPKPVRTCVAVKSLPMGTDIEIECVALVPEKLKSQL